MTSQEEHRQGFEAGYRVLPTPPVEISTQTKERMATALSAIVHGATPEEVADHLDDGFPDEVEDALDRPGEREEMDAHVDLLLYAMQTPEPTAA